MRDACGGVWIRAVRLTAAENNIYSVNNASSSRNTRWVILVSKSAGKHLTLNSITTGRGGGIWEFWDGIDCKFKTRHYRHEAAVMNEQLLTLSYKRATSEVLTLSTTIFINYITI